MKSPELDAAIKEAAAWWHLRRPTPETAEKVLRSEILRPKRTSLQSKASDPVTVQLQNQESVLELVSRRRLALTECNRAVPGMARGKVLKLVPAGSFFDGVASALTSGYFDEEDTPPWDTWLAYFKDSRDEWCLLAWVDRSHVPIIEPAVRAHIFNAFSWEDDLSLD